MPQLVKLQDEYRDAGFIVIGNHVQDADDATVAKTAKSLKINFTVTNRGNVDVDGKGNGIPRAFLFDSKGELVEMGHPAEMKKRIVELIDSEPHFLAAGREYAHLKPLADSLKKAKTFTSVLTRLEKESAKSGPSKEEADFLIDRIRKHGQALLDRAKKLETENAFAAWTTYEDVAKRWKGDEIAKSALARTKALDKDKEFQAELGAGRIVEQIRAEIAKLVPVNGKIRLDYALNRKPAAQIQGLWAALSKKYPDAKAKKDMEKEIKELGF
jgi:hypothetical protein